MVRPNNNHGRMSGTRKIVWYSVDYKCIRGKWKCTNLGQNKNWNLPIKQEKLSHSDTLGQMKKSSCWAFILHWMSITKIKLNKCTKSQPRGQIL